MEFKIPHLIVVPTAQSTLPTAGTATTDLTADRFGIFDGTTRLSVTAPALPTNRNIFFAQYSGDNQLGTFKSPFIPARGIVEWRAVPAVCTGTQQITYVGFDEVEDSKTLTSDCDEYYTVTIRLTNERARHLSPAGFTKSYSYKTTCCTDCETPCQTVDCKLAAQAITDLINADPYLQDSASGNRYITASVVSKCTGSPATTVFALTLPDPGTSVGTVTDIANTDITTATGFTNGTYTGVATTATSGSGTGLTLNIVVAGTNVSTVAINAAGTGYEIGDTFKVVGTSITSGTTPADDLLFTVTETTGAEGDLLAEVRDLFAAYVANAETDIVYSADADSSDSDANATGNVRIEMTPSAGVELSDLSMYQGVRWESVTLTAGTEDCICGIKIVGNALSEFDNLCVPSAFPFIFDAVKFSVFTSKGPASTNDFEVYQNCDAWPVTTVQTVTYPIGSGKEYRDIELENFQYYNRVKRQYINPLFNLFTPKVDPAKFYDAYHLSFRTNIDKAFNDIGDQEGTVIVLFEHECPTDTKGAIQTALETAINAYVAESGFPAVAL